MKINEVCREPLMLSRPIVLVLGISIKVNGNALTLLRGIMLPFKRITEFLFNLISLLVQKVKERHGIVSGVIELDSNFLLKSKHRRTETKSASSDRV